MNDDRVDEVLELVGLTSVAARPAGSIRGNASAARPGRRAAWRSGLFDPGRAGQRSGSGRVPLVARVSANFAGQGRMVLMSSHLLNEVGATADDIVVINAGRLVKQVRIAELGIAEATSRVRVSHYDIARKARWPDMGARSKAVMMITGITSGPHYEVATVGTALFSASVVVYELVTESTTTSSRSSSPCWRVRRERRPGAGDPQDHHHPPLVDHADLRLRDRRGVRGTDRASCGVIDLSDMAPDVQDPGIVRASTTVATRWRGSWRW